VRIGNALEAVSKFQIAFTGKAPLDEKAEHIQSYVSILKKSATPPLDVRWDFETASTILDVLLLGSVVIAPKSTASKTSPARKPKNFGASGASSTSTGPHDFRRHSSRRARMNDRRRRLR